MSNAPTVTRPQEMVFFDKNLIQAKLDQINHANSLAPSLMQRKLILLDASGHHYHLKQLEYESNGKLILGYKRLAPSEIMGIQIGFA